MREVQSVGVAIYSRSPKLSVLLAVILELKVYLSSWFWAIPKPVIFLVNDLENLLSFNISSTLSAKEEYHYSPKFQNQIMKIFSFWKTERV